MCYFQFQSVLSQLKEQQGDCEVGGGVLRSR